MKINIKKEVSTTYYFMVVLFFVAMSFLYLNESSKYRKLQIKLQTTLNSEIKLQNDLTNSLLLNLEYGKISNHLQDYIRNGYSKEIYDSIREENERINYLIEKIKHK